VDREITPVPGLHGYGASRDGRIWSRRGIGSQARQGDGLVSQWREKESHIGRHGYLQVSIVRERGKRCSNVCVHSLVAAAFLGPTPEGLEIRHKNGDRFDNSGSNLCFGTPKQNAEDRDDHGTTVRGSKHHAATLTEEQVKEIRNYPRVPGVGVMLAARYEVAPCVISDIRTGRTWRHVA
jgi:hypothetical protein